MPPTAEAAERFNQQLRVTAAAIVGQAATEHEYGFCCECGCGGTVALTLSQYDRQGGARLQRHEPKA
jgi:hypothetical protein